MINKPLIFDEVDRDIAQVIRLCFEIAVAFGPLRQTSPVAIALDRAWYTLHEAQVLLRDLQAKTCR